MGFDIKEMSIISLSTEIWVFIRIDVKCGSVFHVVIKKLGSCIQTTITFQFSILYYYYCSLIPLPTYLLYISWYSWLQFSLPWFLTWYCQITSSKCTDLISITKTKKVGKNCITRASDVGILDQKIFRLRLINEID